ncbi:hypothetical protein N9245_00370 [bacterium]|nr:hypothetical protein [bacterium]
MEEQDNIRYNSYPQLNGYILNDIVSFMETICLPSKFSTGASYDLIAKDYIDIYVRAMLKNVTDKGIISEVSYKYIRDNLSYRFTDKQSNKKIYWYEVLELAYPLWRVIEKGYAVNNNKTQLTQIQPLVKLDDLLDYRYAVNWGLKDNIYIDYQEPVWRTEIDRESLDNWLKFADNINTRDRLTARTLMERTDLDNYVDNNFHYSDYGRMYLTGPNNLQGMKKKIREAALGECYRYDIKSSVFSYMMWLIKKHNPQQRLPYIIDLVDNKHRVRQTLVADCIKNTNATDAVKTIFVKEALTAISFGLDVSNSYSKIQKIILQPDDRDRFIQHEIVQGLITEIKHYKDIIEEKYKQSNYKKEIEFMDRKTIARKCAYDYQSTENIAIQNVVRELGIDPLLIVHDCLYTKKPLPMLDATVYLQDILGPYAKFEKKEINNWQDRTSWDQTESDIQDHKQRIQQEERQAILQSHSNTLIQTSGSGDRWDDIHSAKQFWKGV